MTQLEVSASVTLHGAIHIKPQICNIFHSLANRFLERNVMRCSTRFVVVVVLHVVASSMFRLTFAWHVSSDELLIDL